MGAGLALPAWAQAKPLFDTINMFVPAAPGGGWDGTARAIERAAKVSGLVGNFQFENVGGAIFDCVLERLNDFARLALCGMISQYNLLEPDGLRNIGEILNKNATLQGFRVTSYPQHRARAQQDIKALLRSGALQPTETCVDGL